MDTAAFGERFHACCDVHAVAVDGAVVFFDDITEVNADPEVHAPVIANLDVSAFNRFLDFDSALNRFYCTGELSKNVVAWRIDDTAFVALDNVTNCGAVLLERSNGADKKGKDILQSVVSTVAWHMRAAVCSI